MRHKDNVRRIILPASAQFHYLRSIDSCDERSKWTEAASMLFAFAVRSLYDSAELWWVTAWLIVAWAWLCHSQLVNRFYCSAIAFSSPTRRLTSHNYRLIEAESDHVGQQIRTMPSEPPRHAFAIASIRVDSGHMIPALDNYKIANWANWPANRLTWMICIVLLWIRIDN